MLRIAVRRGDPDGARFDALALQIDRLVRHSAYRSETIVSPLLLRHLPKDAGYAWRGEEALRDRLAAAGLGPAGLEHVLADVRAELLRLRRPGDA